MLMTPATNPGRWGCLHRSSSIGVRDAAFFEMARDVRGKACWREDLYLVLARPPYFDLIPGTCRPPLRTHESFRVPAAGKWSGSERRRMSGRLPF
jgi:hypothetical protein